MSTPHSPQPRVGDVIHGHRWDGSAWIEIDDPAAQNVSPVTSVTAGPDADPVTAPDAGTPGRRSGRFSAWRQPPKARQAASPASAPAASNVVSGPVVTAPAASGAGSFGPRGRGSGKKGRRGPAQQRRQTQPTRQKRPGGVTLALIVVPAILAGGFAVTKMAEQADPRPAPRPSSLAPSWDTTQPPGPLPESGVLRDVAQFYGDFPPLVHTGVGNVTIPLPEGVESGYVEFSAPNASWIDATLEGADGKRLDSTFCSAADAQPCRGVLLARKQAPRTLRVEASEQLWTLRFAPIWTMPVRTEPTSGSGSMAFLYTGPAADWRLSGDAYVHAQYGNQSASWSTFKDRPTDDDEIFSGPAIVEVRSSADWKFERI